MRISDWSSDVCSSDLTRKHKFSTSSRGGAGSDHSRRLLLCNARDAETLRQQAHPAGECNVKDAVYKVTEVVGTSTKGIEDAIQRAISRTAKTVHHIRWFEVAEMRGQEIGRASVRERVCQ